jgi:4-hydroxy-2-oxoheptanedioate aldolase
VGADLFTDANGQPRCLRGVAMYTGSPRLAELAGRVGFDTVWIEMEHSPTDWNQAEAICIATENGGGVPTIRVPSGDRTHVLRALEVGARIVVVPMVNHPNQAKEVVRHGKFPPLGERGYNSRTRGVNYGLNGTFKSSLTDINQRVHLFVQIETREAVENLAGICDVEGISGIFIGPGDLSLSYGWAGQLDHPELIQVVSRVISAARKAGKLSGILVAPGPLLHAAVEAGSQLLIAGGDVADLTTAWSQLLGRIK